MDAKEMEGVALIATAIDFLKSVSLRLTLQHAAQRLMRSY
jgi:hypothetical protein